ncbi:MAG: prolyl oligopeptidase family serine peptidase [Actinomycetes bacterium]
MTEDLTVPLAERDDLVEQLFGHSVADPYRWLEDPSDPRTQSWLAAQDVLFAQERQRWPGRQRLSRRLGELLAAGVESPPVWRGERRFLVRRQGDQEHAVLVTVDPGGAERVLIDPLGIDPTGQTTLDAWQPSIDGERLAYQLSAGGTEESVLRVMEVDSRQVVDGPIDRARYSPVAWLPGADAYYYVRRLAPGLVPAGEDQYHRRIWLHRVGTDPDQDTLVFGADQPITTYFGVSVSRDGRWLVIAAAEGTAPRNDLWIADLGASDLAAPVLLEVQRGVDAQTGLDVGRDGRAYLLTDRDAPRGRLAVTDPADPGPEGWTDLVGEDPEAVMDGYAILDGPELGEDPVLLVSWTRHAVSEISLHDLRTGVRRGTVALPGLGSLTGLTDHPEGGCEAWIGYTDHTTPSSVYRYDARDGSVTLWADAPGAAATGPRPQVRTEQVTYPSADGTTVRMLVLSADGPTDRPRPTILYGYGGFGVSLTPGYSATTLAWVEAGGVYAVANLRGGGEEGEGWHRDGMLGNKRNVFDDLHAAAEHLISAGWTTPDLLSISGGSNGGLLVGAALVQRPELYRAVTCSAPLLDMVRFERFGLGATWAVEYGTATDPEQLTWLLAYSPYHQVREEVAYPAVLFTVFDGDTRVDPMHARKMCAALQHASTSAHPVLLRRESDVGHGARALSRSIELSADVLAFTAAELGLELP